MTTRRDGRFAASLEPGFLPDPIGCGLAGVGGSLLGSHWNKAADPDALLLAFSGLSLLLLKKQEA